MSILTTLPPQTFDPSITESKWTSRGPLTSVFTPRAESCFYHTKSGYPDMIYMQHGAYGVPGGSDCYPTPAAGVTVNYGATDDTYGWYEYYYSPAYACPSGWETALSLTPKPGAVLTSAGVSAYLCCPSGLRGDEQFGLMGCSMKYGPGQLIYNITDVSAMTFNSVSTVASTEIVTVSCDGIPIFFDPKDKAKFGPTITGSTAASDTSMSGSRSTLPSASQSSIQTNDTSASSTSIGGSASTMSPSTSSSSGRLSTGAKAGIAVAGACFAILVLLGIFIFIRRYRKRELARKFVDNGDIGAELDGAVNSKEKKTTGELYGDSYVQTVELYTSEITHELPSANPEILPSGFTSPLPPPAYHSTTPPGISPIPRKAAPNTHQTPVVSSNDDKVATFTSRSTDEERLRVLRERIERIRADKERLENIERLKLLEQQTEAEMLAAQNNPERIETLNQLEEETKSEILAAQRKIGQERD